MKSISGKITFWILLCCFVSTFFSCSMQVEKRRYTKGYYVHVVKKNKRDIFPTTDDVNNVIPTKEMKTESVRQNRLLVLQNKSIPQVGITPKQKVKGNTPIIKMIPITTHKSQHLKSASKQLKILPIKQDADKKLKTRKILAWIFGAIGMALFVVGLILGITFSFGLGPYIIAIAAGAGAFFGIIALLTRFAGLKKEKEQSENYKPKSETFIKAAFIFSVILISLAVIAFAFSFFIYPFGFIALIIGSIALPASIVGSGLSLRALKDDKSVKTKLSVAFSIIAFILAILAIILIFL